MIDEGYIKYVSTWQQTAALTNPELDTLIKWRRPLYAAGLIGHYAEHNVGYGNISVRVAAGPQFLISGTQTGHLADLNTAHFSLVTDYDIKDNRVTCRGAIQASSESMTHAAIYQLNDDIRAVVHVHSADLWSRYKDRASSTAADVAYGTPAMAAEFSRLFNETDFAATGIAAMAGHEEGLISIGNTMQQATERILTLNAKIRS